MLYIGQRENLVFRRSFTEGVPLKKRTRVRPRTVKIPQKKPVKIKPKSSPFPKLSRPELSQVRRKLQFPRDHFIKPLKKKKKARARIVTYVDDEGRLIRTEIPKTFDCNDPVWRKILFQGLLDNCGRLGAACESVGICKGHLYHLFDRDPEFEKWVRAMQDRAVDVAEDELIRRGVVGYEKAIYYKGRIVGHVKEFSDQNLVRYLAAYRTRYRTTNVEVGGTGGGSVPIKIEHDIAEKILKDEHFNRLIHDLLGCLEGDAGGDGESAEPSEVDPHESSEKT